MPHSRAKFLTVRQVAELSGVTERTVWSDIRTKRIDSVRVRGRRLIPRVSLANYRSANLERKNLLTVKQFALLSPYSERTIWSDIREGVLPVVRVSRRRLYIPATIRWPWGDQSVVAEHGGYELMWRLIKKFEMQAARGLRPQRNGFVILLKSMEKNARSPDDRARAKQLLQEIRDEIARRTGRNPLDVARDLDEL